MRHSFFQNKWIMHDIIDLFLRIFSREDTPNPASIDSQVDIQRSISDDQKPIHNEGLFKADQQFDDSLNEKASISSGLFLQVMDHFYEINKYPGFIGAYNEDIGAYIYVCRPYVPTMKEIELEKVSETEDINQNVCEETKLSYIIINV